MFVVLFQAYIHTRQVEKYACPGREPNLRLLECLLNAPPTELRDQVGSGMSSFKIESSSFNITAILNEIKIFTLISKELDSILKYRILD